MDRAVVTLKHYIRLIVILPILWEMQMNKDLRVMQWKIPRTQQKIILKKMKGPLKTSLPQNLVKASLFETLSGQFPVWYNLNAVCSSDCFSVSEFKAFVKSGNHWFSYKVRAEHRMKLQFLL